MSPGWRQPFKKRKKFDRNPFGNVAAFGRSIETSVVHHFWDFSSFDSSDFPNTWGSTSGRCSTSTSTRTSTEQLPVVNEPVFGHPPYGCSDSSGPLGHSLPSRWPLPKRRWTPAPAPTTWPSFWPSLRKGTRSPGRRSSSERLTGHFTRIVIKWSATDLAQVLMNTLGSLIADDCATLGQTGRQPWCLTLIRLA